MFAGTYAHTYYRLCYYLLCVAIVAKIFKWGLSVLIWVSAAQVVASFQETANMFVLSKRNMLYLRSSVGVKFIAI